MTTLEANAIERRLLLLTFLERSECATDAGPQGEAPVNSGGRRSEEKPEATAFIKVSMGKAGQGRANSLGLASLDNCGGLWGAGAIPSCPLPDLTLI